MAPPEKRAVAPGAQPLRVDNIKDKSWVDARKSPPLIGQIFFVTDDATIRAEDQAVLDTIKDTYYAKLIRARDTGQKVDFDYFGYADYRHTVEHNHVLAQNRADAVASYVAWSLQGGYGSYRGTAKGFGVDHHGDDKPATSQALQRYRRVDIMAPSPDLPPPPKQDAPADALSREWKARLIRGVAGGWGGTTAVEVFQIEIVDRTNNLAMMFKYMGAGVGASIKSTPGFTVDKSSWVSFRTMLKMSVMDFQGLAYHASGQAQMSGGASSDNVKLYGPEKHRGDAPVNLEWLGISDWGSKGAGLGLMITTGGIEPDPPKQKPYPAPGD